MGKYFEEIDHQVTPLGDLTLSRRRIAMLDNQDVFEIKLNDEYLMTSLFYDSEVALAKLGLAALKTTGETTEKLDVAVGGLGLGFTAVAALEDPRVQSLVVVDYLEAVIGWHQRGLVPLGKRLCEDPRTRFVHGDFFKLAADPARGLDTASPGKLFHAILLDVDHSPRHLLSEAHAALYTEEGLQKLVAQLHPGGVFALWSNDPPDEDFLAKLHPVFPQYTAHVVRFANPIQGGKSQCTVYVAVTSATE